MPDRFIRHEREGDAPGVARDTQVNGRAIPSDEVKDAHSAFYDPVGASWTGFAHDGIYYQEGKAVRRPATGRFGDNDGDFGLNQNQWQEQQIGCPRVYVDGGIEVSPSGGVGNYYHLYGRDRVGRRWQLRGDFRIELFVPHMFLTPGSGDGDGQDNAVMLQLSRVAAPAATYSGKYFRTPFREGFAVEVTGVGFFEGYFAQQAESMVMVMVREAGVLKVYARHGVDDDRSGGNLTPVLFEDEAPGIMQVDVHVRDEGALPWDVTLEDFRLAQGWTDYSREASWWQERGGVVLLEKFVGDELDPRIWTSDASGGTSEVIVANDSVTLRSQGVGGTASIELPAITGDFSLTMNVDWTRASIYDLGTAFRMKVHTGDADLPSVSLRILYLDDATHVDIAKRADDAADEMVEAVDDTLPWLVPIPMRGRVEVTKTGGRLAVRFIDLELGRPFVDRVIVDLLPSVPIIITMSGLGESSAADFNTRISYLILNSPHCMAALEGWPARYYCAAMVATPDETVAADGNDPIVADLTFIDVTTRRPFWRAVAAADQLVESGQALRAGSPGRLWADPINGAVMVPVARATPMPAVFCHFDFGYDRVIQREDLAVYTHAGPLRWRHFALPDPSPQATFSTFVDGNPLAFATVAGAVAGQTFDIWVTATGVRIAEFLDGNFNAEVNLAVADAEEVDFALTAAVIVPRDGLTPASLVLAAERAGDGVVAVYRDIGTAYGLGDEAVHFEHADARYVGQDPDAENTGAGWTSCLYRVGAPEVTSLAARRSDYRIIFAVTRPDGATVLHEASPYEVAHFHWADETVPGGDPEPPAAIDLLAPPTSVWLSTDAELDGASGAGVIAFQEAGDDAAVQVVTLATRLIRSTITPAMVGADADEPSGLGVMGIEQPPGSAAGLRLVWGYGLAGSGNVTNAIVEWDDVLIVGGGWGGPHIGGTEIKLSGWGLEQIVEIRVGDVDCARAIFDESKPDAPVLRAVVRALGWIEHGSTPVMSNAELEGTETWPKNVELRFADGSTITLEGAFTYESRLCIERALARMSVRLPDEVIHNDPKANALQRHILTAVAWEVCRVVCEFLEVIERDTFRGEAKGEGLDAWGASYGVKERPLPGMSDDAFASFIAAKAFGQRLTTKAIRDLLEPVFGYRPEIEEGYRQFTVLFDVEQAGGVEWLRNFWGVPGAADALDTAFMDRDHWGGQDPRVEAARQILDSCRAAGVAANVRIIA